MQMKSIITAAVACVTLLLSTSCAPPEDGDDLYFAESEANEAALSNEKKLPADGGPVVARKYVGQRNIWPRGVERPVVVPVSVDTDGNTLVLGFDGRSGAILWAFIVDSKSYVLLISRQLGQLREQGSDAGSTVVQGPGGVNGPPLPRGGELNEVVVNKASLLAMTVADIAGQPRR